MNVDSTSKLLKAPLEAIRGYRVEGVAPSLLTARDTFDAVGLQSLPIREALYETRFIEGRWQMSAV